MALLLQSGALIDAEPPARPTTYIIEKTLIVRPRRTLGARKPIILHLRTRERVRHVCQNGNLDFSTEATMQFAPGFLAVTFLAVMLAPSSLLAQSTP